MTDLTVKLTKTINAPAARIFDAWLDAELLSKFMLPQPGMPSPRVEVDGRQGGRFAIYMIHGDDEIPHRGEYLEITPHSKLVFTWESPFSLKDSTVTILFKEVSAGVTEIDFTHLKFKGEDERKAHEGGWSEILVQLKKFSEAQALQPA